jgi:hypothetical protein
VVRCCDKWVGESDTRERRSGREFEFLVLIIHKSILKLYLCSLDQIGFTNITHNAL